MNKVCNSCRIEKPVKEFHKNKNRPDGIQVRCKQCAKESDKQSYLKRSNKYKEYNRDYYNRNREYILNQKKKGKCVDCGINDYRVLEFDHVKGKKEHNLSNMAFFSRKRINEELEKCEIRCANCHRIVTLERRENNNSGM